MNVGIVSYGAYIPRYRIRVEEIAKVWGANANSIIDGLMVFEKSVPDLDEDTITIAVEAARYAINRANINPEKIGAIYTGSESHPYAVKPSSTVIAEAIGATPDLTVADFEFACKAGTAAIQTCMGMVETGMIELGMAIGSDVSQGAPGDALEYTAAAGGVAYIIGKKDQVANIESTYSYTTDTPDFWRREGMPYPEHGGRFTGEPGYFKHVSSAAEGLMKRMGTKPSDYNYAIFHQPNGKFPTRVAKMLGFSSEQIKPGLVVPRLGNTYSGSCMMGLAATLDIAKAGDRIFMTSFGSGAGSDAFSFMVTDRIEEI
ncbi:MAG TPA: hydroxymethylglutaryl-CoA synthase, partial [Candidatus Methanoperedens sp.]